MAVLGQNQCAPAPNGTPKNLFVCCLFDLVGQTTQTAARYDGFHGDHLAAMKLSRDASCDKPSLAIVAEGQHSK